MGIRARGVANIKTYSAVRGSGVHSNERHVHLFQMASLELERSRRQHERKAAMDRIKKIDARAIEIEALIRKHQIALDAASAEATSGNPAEQPLDTVHEAATKEKRRKLRY